MAAAQLSLGTQFQEELTCSICLQLFTRPKVLPCQHTFCQDCIESHAAWLGGIFQCPICRQQVGLPPQGVAGLPDSHIVANLCEKLQTQATLSGENVQSRIQNGGCSFHPFQQLKLYCRSCQVPICELCLEETHDGHPTTTIKKGSQEKRYTVQGLINEGKNILESYSIFITGLTETEKTLNEQKEQTDNAITQAYIALLAKVEQNHRENLNRIQTERDRVVTDFNELSAACDRAEQELQQGVVMFPSQENIMVMQKYREKAAPTPVQTQPAVFRPTDIATVLGHVTVQYLPSGPIQFGKTGSGAGEFNNPTGVTVSDKGEIFVADRENRRIQVFTLQGTFVHQFPTVIPGTCDKLYMKPYDIAMDGEGNLWVVGCIDPAKREQNPYMGRWVQRKNSGEDKEVAVQYSTQGRLGRKFYLQMKEGHRGVAVDTMRNHILITNSTGFGYQHNSGVLVFNSYGTTENQKWQNFCSSEMEMKCPQYITVDREGNILVSDMYSIVVYHKDCQSWSKFGLERDDAPIGLERDDAPTWSPRGICTDSAGNIIVADRDNGCVEMFDKTGKFVRYIATNMEEPFAVAMTTQGQLVVTNVRSNTVSIFQIYDP